jgi:hypothetical protein
MFILLDELNELLGCWFISTKVNNSTGLPAHTRVLVAQKPSSDWSRVFGAKLISEDHGVRADLRIGIFRQLKKLSKSYIRWKR